MSVSKIITAVAWGLAFRSVTEAALFVVTAIYTGARLGKGHSPEAVLDALAQILASTKAAPTILGALGLALGLKGLLPGTGKRP